jgi:hypothetical protein
MNKIQADMENLQPRPGRRVIGATLQAGRDRRLAEGKALRELTEESENEPRASTIEDERDSGLEAIGNQADVESHGLPPRVRALLPEQLRALDWMLAQENNGMYSPLAREHDSDTREVQHFVVDEVEESQLSAPLERDQVDTESPPHSSRGMTGAMQHTDPDSEQTDEQAREGLGSAIWPVVKKCVLLPKRSTEGPKHSETRHSQQEIDESDGGNEDGSGDGEET